MDDFDFEDIDLGECPVCGAFPIRRRDCSLCGGEGYIDDAYEHDPLWYDPDEFVECVECGGLGYFRWCPECGADLIGEDAG